MTTSERGAESPRNTIFALSTAPGRAALAVIRLSGPRAGPALAALVSAMPRPRHASLRRLLHPETGEPVDDALVLWLPGPGTETGEDMAELHIHGGPAIIRALLRVLGDIDGLRLAEPGEFVRRAFRNGKLDLTAVEGIADLIEAETEGQRRQAMRQASGGLASLYDGWRTRLIEAQALVEAAIDFSDETDVNSDAVARAVVIAGELTSALRRHLDDGRRGEVMRQGLRVVIAGPPNAGKSSLLNMLARREAAIVSEEAGTTRDVIEVFMDLSGLPVILVDTAGLRDVDAPIEREGIRRSKHQAREADLVVWLSEAAEPIAPPIEALGGRAERVIAVATKIDRSPSLDPSTRGISTMTGEGVETLVQTITDKASSLLGDSESPLITQARHREHVTRALVALEAFLASDMSAPELAAEELRRAAHDLGRISGRVDVEDILDHVFSRFCIGK
ncbi:MAG TPA: tRNA uridine-5-carboxymethylaminomethyl(34) synthesis GTPase MnmE [Hyphomicrobiaceae bacterium]|nr:tRNA uridine-5-carboxymethylaminomethyl(34) synthesis GTPase MnmE [Hyphomicrobiaceae bacterium]